MFNYYYRFYNNRAIWCMSRGGIFQKKNQTCTHVTYTLFSPFLNSKRYCYFYEIMLSCWTNKIKISFLGIEIANILLKLFRILIIIFITSPYLFILFFSADITVRLYSVLGCRILESWRPTKKSNNYIVCNILIYI